MANKPPTPKPKLPKPKTPLAQRVKTEARKSLAKGLSKNFGVIGTAIAQKYIAPPKVSHRRIPDPGKANQKNIPKKNIKKDAPLVDSLLESAKQVASTIDIVALNAGRSFSVATRQAQIMGDEISSSLRDLNSILDRMLYKGPQPPPLPSGVGAPPLQSKSTSPETGTGSGVLPIPVPSLKLMGILSIIPGLKMLGLMSGQGGISSSREEMLKEIEKNNQKPEAVEAQKRADAMRGWLGKWFGWTGLFKDAPESGQTDKAELGTDNVIFKMTYKADKITFKSENAIKFKTRAPIGNGLVRPQSGGFFNKLADKMTGGPGGAGFFNNLADRVFGTGKQMPGGVNNNGTSGGASGGAGSSGGGGGSDTTKDYTPGPTGPGAYGKGGNISAEKMVASGVNPLLIESITEGGKAAFGDPSDPETRYVVQMQGGIRNQSSGKHGQGKAVDLQIYDRKTGQFVGGTNDIMKNAFGNPHTYRIYEALHQARYAYIKNKYGEDTAKRMSAGTKFGSSLEGAGADEMHASIDEGGALGPMDKAGKGMIKDRSGRMVPFDEWIKTGQGPYAGSKDLADPTGKSEFHKDNLAKQERIYIGPNRDAEVQKLERPNNAQPETLKDVDKVDSPRRTDPEALRKIPETTRSVAQPQNNNPPQGLNKQNTKTNQNVDTSDLDHRPRREAVPSQKFDDYMGTTSGMEDAD